MSEKTIAKECGHHPGHFRTGEDYRDHLPCELLRDGTRAGAKDDKGKRRFSLLQWESIAEQLKVLEHGAREYAPQGWKLVENARQRYYDALMRHVTAWWMGEETDQKTGLHHLAHAMCNVSFLLALDLAKRAAASPKP